MGGYDLVYWAYLILCAIGLGLIIALGIVIKLLRNVLEQPFYIPSPELRELMDCQAKCLKHHTFGSRGFDECVQKCLSGASTKGEG